MSRRASWLLLLVLVAGVGGTKTVTRTVTVDETAKHGPRRSCATVTRSS